jgi:hypothetical protein
LASNAEAATCIKLIATSSKSSQSFDFKTLIFKTRDGFHMARWIAFDQKTTSILRSALAQGTRIDTLFRGPVDYALAKPSTVIAVLPATGGDLGIAVFRRARAAMQSKAATEHLRRIPPAQPAAHRATTRAGGFLGLSDEPVFEDEAEPVKKGWWRKFWDE